jgi:hypothetical protein
MCVIAPIRCTPCEKLTPYLKEDVMDINKNITTVQHKGAI